MTIVLDHTIVDVTDPAATAAFLTDILGLEPAKKLGPFTMVQIGPSTFDFTQADGSATHRHFAFRVSEEEFDTIFGRVRQRGLRYWADPRYTIPNQINHWDDGRGVYFDDPDGNSLEVLTRSYGSAGCAAKHPHPLLKCPPK